MTYPILILSQNLPDRPGLLSAAVVLRDMGPDSHHRYVSHIRIANPVEGEPHSVRYSYDHGSYSDNLRKAMETYLERVAERVRVAMAGAYDLSPAPVLAPTVTMPLDIAQAAYGLLDQAAGVGRTDDPCESLNFDGDIVGGTVAGLEDALGRDGAHYREVEAAMTKVGADYKAACDALKAQDAALEA